MQFGRKPLLLLSLFSLIILSLLGFFLILNFQERSLTTALSGAFWQIQLLYGSIYGLATGLIAISLINLPVFRSIRLFFCTLFSGQDIRFIDVVIVSLSAGIGEEILFRAGLQYFIGIWPTAFLFILLHGYLTKNSRWLIMGLTMVLLSAGLGYLYEYFGLLAAMVAHTLYDLLTILHFRSQRIVIAEEEENEE